MRKGNEGTARAGVTSAEIQRIAQLAELAVDEPTAVQLEAQLSRILDYVAQLAELPKVGDGDGDERTVRLRPDEPGRSDPLARPPADWAPAFKGGLFVVPRLGELDKGDDAP
ncbi:MAG: aspartyl/glutamyl-tRNA amidotransferase subunit C [Gemmatimonadales bacterium]